MPVNRIWPKAVWAKLRNSIRHLWEDDWTLPHVAIRAGGRQSGHRGASLRMKSPSLGRLCHQHLSRHLNPVLSISWISLAGNLPLSSQGLEETLHKADNRHWWDEEQSALDNGLLQRKPLWPHPCSSWVSTRMKETSRALNWTTSLLWDFSCPYMTLKSEPNTWQSPFLQDRLKEPRCKGPVLKNGILQPSSQNEPQQSMARAVWQSQFFQWFQNNPLHNHQALTIPVTLTKVQPTLLPCQALFYYMCTLQHSI